MSQPFDRSYDKFAAYVSQHISRLWRAKGIPLDSIYGRDWYQEAKNLALLRPCTGGNLGLQTVTIAGPCIIR
jgi:hypothetical protein